jgi:hypothetical protein
MVRNLITLIGTIVALAVAVTIFDRALRLLARF